MSDTDSSPLEPATDPGDGQVVISPSQKALGTILKPLLFPHADLSLSARLYFERIQFFLLQYIPLRWGYCLNLLNVLPYIAAITPT